MFNKLYAKIKKNLSQIIFILVILFVLIGFNIELPYTIYVPGGTSNLSTNIKVVNEQSNTGTYKSLYVLTLKANLFTYLFAKVKSNWDIIENKDLSLNDEDYDEILERDKILLNQSKNFAIMNAYNKANKEFKISNSYVYVIGSECDIKIGEIVTEIDGIKINKKFEIRDIVNNKNIGDECIVKTTKNDKSYTRSIKVKEKNGIKVLGIYIIDVINIDTNGVIKINNNEEEAGSSAGLMLALTIYDKLIEQDLSNGKIIVGTGSIEEDGNISKIAGLKYKMLGLSKEKFDVFFIPYDNLEEANEINEKYKLNMNFVPVKTFDEAVNYLISVNN